MSKAKPSHTGRAKHLRSPWDTYETALLLDMYFRIERGEITRSRAISELSERLRALGVKRGIKIDDIYRNENGISTHLSHMVYALTDGKAGLWNAAQIHYQVFQMYREDREHYERILEEAKAMIEG